MIQIVRWFGFSVIVICTLVTGYFLFQGNLTDLDIALPGNIFKYHGALTTVLAIPAVIAAIIGFFQALGADIVPYKEITTWSDGSKTSESHSGCGNYLFGLILGPIIYGYLAYAALYYIIYIILKIAITILPYLVGILLIGGMALYFTNYMKEEEYYIQKKPLIFFTILAFIIYVGMAFVTICTPFWMA